MLIEFGPNKMLDMLYRQLSNFFYLSESEKTLLSLSIEQVLSKTEKCFDKIENKYFKKNSETYFTPLHSGQYLIFLYYFSHIMFLNEKSELADKIYYLNKIMNSCDIYHEVVLPDVFYLEHPVGTVLGRAKYSDGFVALQHCTVGGNKGKYPQLGINFKMLSGSKILGDSIVGNNVTLSANSYVKDTNIPDGVTVFGSSPNLIFKYL